MPDDFRDLYIYIYIYTSVTGLEQSKYEMEEYVFYTGIRFE